MSMKTVSCFRRRTRLEKGRSTTVPDKNSKTERKVWDDVRYFLENWTYMGKKRNDNIVMSDNGDEDYMEEILNEAGYWRFENIKLIEYTLKWTGRG